MTPALLGLLLGALTPGTRAQDASMAAPVATGVPIGPSVPTPAAVGSGTAPTVGRIEVEPKNVFDPSLPGEDWWPFRFANRIHVPTRPGVVRREVLLKPGEPWDPRKAIETERNLRSLGFIRRAEVAPSTSPSGALDLRVLTQDSWTLAPTLSIGTEGGDSFFIWGVQEKNLLGWGKTVSFFHSQLGSEKRNEFRYRDPRVLKSWFEFTNLYAQTPRGDEMGLLLNRPFYSLDTAYSARASWARIIEEDVLYQDALETSKFIQNYRTATLRLGARVSRDERFVQRLYGGTFYSRSRFDATADTSPGTLPDDRLFSGPMAGYSWVIPRYIKEENIDSIRRAEDFNVGNELSLFAVPSLRSWGADRDRWLFNAMDQQGLYLAPGRFALAQVGGVGRVARNRLENTIFFANLNLFWKTWWPLPQTFVAHMEVNTTRNLDRENQLILGGNTGLRGYKNNSFTGGRTVLLNFEDRLFYDRQLLHLVYVGGVAFFESGVAVPAGAPVRTRDFKSDVGLGLRISPSRSTTGGVLRLDVAYALNSGPGTSRWVVSIRGGQAFAIFNSTTRSALRAPDAALAEESASARIRRR